MQTILVTIHESTAVISTSTIADALEIGHEDVMQAVYDSYDTGALGEITFLTGVNFSGNQEDYALLTERQAVVALTELDVAEDEAEREGLQNFTFNMLVAFQGSKELIEELAEGEEDEAEYKDDLRIEQDERVRAAIRGIGEVMQSTTKILAQVIKKLSDLEAAK